MFLAVDHVMYIYSLHCDFQEPACIEEARDEYQLALCTTMKLPDVSVKDIISMFSALNLL